MVTLQRNAQTERLTCMVEGATTMSDEEDTRWKEILEDHKRSLQRHLSKRLDAVEASAADVEHYFGMALAEMATQALRHVDDALARLERREYGFCTDCQERICHARLRAVPSALRCRGCEELREVVPRARRLSARPEDSWSAYEERLLRVTRRGRE